MQHNHHVRAFRNNDVTELALRAIMEALGMRAQMGWELWAEYAASGEWV